MGNIKRYFEDNFAYFVTTVTYERKPIFMCEKAIDLLLMTIEYFKLTLDYKIFAFCILPEHIHLVIQPSGVHDLSFIMKMIKGEFSRRFNKLIGTSGHIWQKRFYDEGIRNENMLREKINYIHFNPVKHNIVSTLDAFQHSSFQYYFNDNLSLLKIDPYK